MKTPRFLTEYDFLVLMAIFMIVWTILSWSILSIWQNKKIEEWKKQTEVISDLRKLLYDR